MATISTLNSQIRFLTNTDSTSYSSSDLYANLTRWAHLFTAEIIDAQDDWDFQGEIATANLVANQREYVFPTDILKIKRIDLMLDGSNWYRANWMDESEIGTSLASESDITEKFTNDNPYVALYDKSFFIFSGTITSVTNGIKIWYSKEIVGVDTSGDDITSFSADTDKPNIAEAFQRGLVYGAAKDWFDKYELTERSREMERQVNTIIEKMKQLYGQRSERRLKIGTASRLEQYE